MKIKIVCCENFSFHRICVSKLWSLNIFKTVVSEHLSKLLCHHEEVELSRTDFCNVIGFTLFGKIVWSIFAAPSFYATGFLTSPKVFCLRFAAPLRSMA